VNVAACLGFAEPGSVCIFGAVTSSFATSFRWGSVIGESTDSGEESFHRGMDDRSGLTISGENSKLLGSAMGEHTTSST
jgi:hypothetical protein